MRTTLIVLGSAVFASATDGDCFSNTKQDTCAGSTEAGESCVWCSSAAVGDSCFKESDAQGLPSSVFKCDLFAPTPQATDCTSHKSENDCMSSSEGSESCAWCTSGAVGNACYKHSDAETLPESVFRCEYQDLFSLKAEECTSHTSEKDCMSSSEGGETCSWCTSGAVGNSCMKHSDAETLPSSVFRCEYQDAYGLKAVECTTHSSESECMTSSEGNEACAWCTSAAVGNTCFKNSDAEGLPSSVFRCEYQDGYDVQGAECTSHKSENDCMSSSEGSETCAWCTSGAVGNACYKHSDAETLPESVFRCEYQTWYQTAFTVAKKFLGF